MQHYYTCAKGSPIDTLVWCGVLFWGKNIFQLIAPADGQVVFLIVRSTLKN